MRGMICTRCNASTDCSPDLSHLSIKRVIDLCAAWLCSDCLDQDQEAQAFEAEERSIAESAPKEPRP